MSTETEIENETGERLLTDWEIEQHEDNIARVEAILEWHKNNPLLSSQVYTGNVYISARTDKDMRDFCDELGSYTKHSDSYSVSARKPLLPDQSYPYVSVSIDHSSFCEKVETGMEEITEEVVPEGVELIEVTKLVPTYEWKCPESWK